MLGTSVHAMVATRTTYGTTRFKSLHDDGLAHRAAALRAVALLAVDRLDAAVAAVRAGRAALRARAGAVGGVGVRRAVVALLGAVHDHVAAVGRERAVLVASAV